ncbi:MAG: ParB/RepB/Spo0J family partition protein [Candidatus Sulfotelmatobacter sp.]
MAIAAEKKEEKAEKRRALGRGLESLLPGPRVVAPSPEPRAPGTGSAVDKQLPQEPRSAASPAPIEPDAETPASEEASAPHALPHKVISIQPPAMPESVVVSLPIDSIHKNPYQTRYVFDEEQLIELRDSIKEHGVVQPVVVRPGEEGRFILVLGERRLRASKMAGRDTVPALVRTLSPQQAAEMTVLENVVREDLNPIEQAEAFRVLSKEFQLTQAQIAERIGVSRESVANYMRLLRLPEKAMKYMVEGRLTFSDARGLLALDSPEQIMQLAEEVVTRHLKWDEIEQRVRELKGLGATPREERKSAGARWMDPNVRAAQTEMERTLGMRVRIKDRNGKGRIVIEYASVDDYERVVEMLKGKSA